MSEELKPCPFCGSKDLNETDNGAQSAFVECLSCGSCGPCGIKWTRRDEWNSRTGTVELTKQELDDDRLALKAQEEVALWTEHTVEQARRADKAEAKLADYKKMVTESTIKHMEADELESKKECIDFYRWWSKQPGADISRGYDEWANGEYTDI